MAFSKISNEHECQSFYFLSTVHVARACHPNSYMECLIHQCVFALDAGGCWLGRVTSGYSLSNCSQHMVFLSCCWYFQRWSLFNGPHALLKDSANIWCVIDDGGVGGGNLPGQTMFNSQLACRHYHSNYTSAWNRHRRKGLPQILIMARVSHAPSMKNMQRWF